MNSHISPERGVNLSKGKEILPDKTGLAEMGKRLCGKYKIGRKWSEHRRQIGGIHKHVGGKTAEGEPSAEN